MRESPSRLSLRIARRGSCSVAFMSSPCRIELPTTTFRLPGAAAGILRRPWSDFAQNFVTRPERLLLAVSKDQYLIACCEKGWSVRNEYDNRPACLEIKERLLQRCFTLAIEIGVRLVENHKEGIAVQSAGQSDALPLAARKNCAMLADPGVIAGRKPQNHIVRAGRSCGPKYQIGIRFDAHPSDVFQHRPIEQLDGLRQESDMRTKMLGVPLIESRAVKSHRAFSGRARCR